MIPKTIYICYKHLEQIQQTAQNWATLNPEYTIQLYDDERCEHFLLTEYGVVHRDLFRYIPDGPIKADFWRICILYKYGGVYVDADIEPLVPLREVVVDDVDFLTCRSLNGEYNPHLIMVKLNDPILDIGINRYITAFMNNCQYNYWDWSIVALFCELFNSIGMPKLSDGVYVLHNRKYQFLQENNEYKSENIDDLYKQQYGLYCQYNNVRVLNNRYKNYDYEKHEFCI
jgi:mannosyltransferase OCH1-like enzyme